MKINNKTKIVILSILGILIIVLAVSYAYFKPILDAEKSTRVEVVAKTIDQLMFIQGKHLGLELNHLNFTQGSGNLTDSTTTTAKLVANTKTNTASKTYYVYFYIGKNEFDYSTDTNEPEIILTIKNPSGNNITSISGLTYVTKPDVSGFDITNYQGLITIAEEYSISTTSSTTGTEQDWEAIVTVRNLDINQNMLAGSRLSAQFVLSSEEKTIFSFGDLILTNNLGKTYIESKTSPNFSSTATTNEGMFAMEDDYGMSYYFRGAVDNNWVKFANFYWRIVRINGDGSVKLVYTSTTPPIESEKVVMEGEDTEVDISSFSTSFNSAEYIGFMRTYGEHRGHSTSSTIKTNLETWYTNNLLEHEENLKDFIVCNDREFTVDDWVPKGLPSVDKYSNVYRRLYTSNTPQLICTNQEDRYTVQDIIIGNGQLTNPIGLMTADEITLAGGYRSAPNSSYYLYTGQYYWLVSPYNVYVFGPSIFSVSSSGAMIDTDVTAEFGMRPVISLSPDVSVSGSGHWDDPYVVE